MFKYYTIIFSIYYLMVQIFLYKYMIFFNILNKKKNDKKISDFIII